MSPILDGNKIKQITNATPTAEVTMMSLALRQRMRPYSNLRQAKMQLIREGAKVVDKEFVQFWKELEDADVGSLVYGKTGQPEKFQWYYNLKTIARAAIEGKPINTEKLPDVEKKMARTARAKLEAKPRRKSTVQVTLTRSELNLFNKLLNKISK